MKKHVLFTLLFGLCSFAHLYSQKVPPKKFPYLNGFASSAKITEACNKEASQSFQVGPLKSDSYRACEEFEAFLLNKDGIRQDGDGLEFLINRDFVRNSLQRIIPEVYGDDMATTNEYLFIALAIEVIRGRYEKQQRQKVKEFEAKKQV